MSKIDLNRPFTEDQFNYLKKIFSEYFKIEIQWNPQTHLIKLESIDYLKINQLTENEHEYCRMLSANQYMYKLMMAQPILMPKQSDEKSFYRKCNGNENE